MVYGNLAWNPNAFQYRQRRGCADAATGATLNAIDPGLDGISRARRQAHSLSRLERSRDPPAESTINYYESVVAKLARIPRPSFIRLFLAPACSTASTGRGQQLRSRTVSTRATRNTTWSRLWSSGSSKGLHRSGSCDQVQHRSRSTTGVLRTRPLCAYPAWPDGGLGSTDDAAKLCVCYTGLQGETQPRLPTSLFVTAIP